MFSRLWGLIKKEFIILWRDPKSRYLIIVPPIVQFVIFANILTMEVKDADVAVLDYANTLESREFVAGFSGSSWFRNIYQVKDINEFRELIRSQKADMGLILNNDFSEKLKRGETVSVQLVLDGRVTMTAANLGNYSAQIAAVYSEKVLQKSGQSGASINLVTRSWFSPNALYQWYLVIALVAVIDQVITLVLTALSVARERELGTFEQLIVSPYTATDILIAKTVPPLFIVLIMTLVTTGLASLCFSIPFAGSFLLFLLSCFIALLSFVGVGLFISSVTRNQQQAILGAFAFMMPAILLSGFISPVDDMPQILQYLTYLNPVRFFLTFARGIFLKNMPFDDVLMQLVPLVLIAAGTLTLAARTFKKNLE